MDSGTKVLSRFLTAEAIADPKVALANFVELIRRAEEKVEVPLGTVARALQLTEAGTLSPAEEAELRNIRDLSYRVAAWLKMLPENAYIHGSGLFLSILQKYTLPAGLRKKVEIASRAFAAKPRPRVPKGLLVFAAWEKLKTTLKGHAEIAAQAIAQGKLHGEDGQSSTKVKAGPFTLINTGGFSEEVMKNVGEAVEKAAKAIQQSGLGKVLYGDIHVTNTLAKSSVLAFYMMAKDEMFVRANVKANYDTVETICHELGHRFEFMFMKGRGAALKRLYYKLTDQERKRRTEDTVTPKIGDIATSKGKTWRVDGFGVSRAKVIVKLERIDLKLGELPEKGSISLEGWSGLAGEGGTRAVRDVDTNPNFEGFVTNYAKQDPSENFAEMFAFYCMGRLPVLQSGMFEEVVFEGSDLKTASRVAARFAADWTTMKFEIRKTHPDMDGKVADLFDAASTLTRTTHAKFQNAKAGIGGPTADDWEDIVEAYGKAIRMWNRVLDSKREHLGSRASDLLTRAENTRKVVLDRDKEAKKQFREALDQERIDSNRP